MKIRKGKSLARMTRSCVLLSLLVSAAGWSVRASATEGDVYAKGTVYCASTYDNHSVYSAVGGVPIDLNVGDGWADNRERLYAPEDGKVTIVTSDGKNDDGWGNSITWTNGKETLYLAHLDEFGKTGSVYGGELIGYVGNTGNSFGPHLHIQSSKGNLVLSGETVSSPNCKKSKGSLKKFFHVEESDGSHSVKIEWYPANKSCVDAYMRFYNNTCDARPAEEICKEAQEGLSGFSWKYLLGDWEKIFLGHEEIKKYVERVGSCSIDKHVDKPDTTCFQF